MRADRAAIAWSLVVLGAAACGNSGEGEGCDPRQGNADCEEGFVCTPAHQVKAAEPVCCPRPPESASVASCHPELGAGSLPDPSIDASFAAGGTGAGGSAGADSAPDGLAGDGTADGPADSTGDG